MSIDFDNSASFDDGDAPEGGGSNSLFIIVAVGLAGLIVLGLIAIGGVLYIRSQNAALQIAQITPEATPTIDLANIDDTPTPATTATPTSTQTSSPLVPADTPTPTATSTPVVQPTNTRVVADGETGSDATPTATRTPIPVGTPAGNQPTPAEVPNTGAGGLELGLIGAGLLAVLFISRRLRQTI